MPVETNTVTVFVELLAPTEIVTAPKRLFFKEGGGEYENVMGPRWVLVLGRVWKYSDPGLLIGQNTIIC